MNMLESLFDDSLNEFQNNKMKNNRTNNRGKRQKYNKKLNNLYREFKFAFPANLPKRDISGAKQSFSELSEFLTRFPDSQYAPYANQRLIYLRNMIAKHELTAADYYLRREAYIAALRRAKYVLEHIPNSSENLRALNILKEAYENLGYLDLLEDVVKTIVINYPNQEL